LQLSFLHPQLLLPIKFLLHAIRILSYFIGFSVLVAYVSIQHRIIPQCLPRDCGQ